MLSDLQKRHLSIQRDDKESKESIWIYVIVIWLKLLTFFSQLMILAF